MVRLNKKALAKAMTGHTITSVASTAGVHRNTISRAVNTSRTSFNTAYKLSQALGVPLSELIQGVR